jgi:hypothetical protein
MRCSMFREYSLFATSVFPFGRRSSFCVPSWKRLFVKRLAFGRLVGSALQSKTPPPGYPLDFPHRKRVDILLNFHTPAGTPLDCSFHSTFVKGLARFCFRHSLIPEIDETSRTPSSLPFRAHLDPTPTPVCSYLTNISYHTSIYIAFGVSVHLLNADRRWNDRR